MAVPTRPPTLEDHTLSWERGLKVLRANVGISPKGKYRHWDKLRHLTPPDGLTVEEWWLGVKLARLSVLRELPLRDAGGRPLMYCMPDEALALLHGIDKRAAGEIAMEDVVTGGQTAKQTYLVNSLMEEAIRSSQLEGANTTRRVAREMIRSGRAPRDRSERMILNNFHALEYIREGVGDSLEPDHVLTLHRILTEGTLDNPDAAGRLQRPKEERVVVGSWKGDIVHRPPPASQLPDRLAQMCRFANGEEDAKGFVHPVVRAILLHFWLAYDHPFEDGNGRTARALFYWSMRTQGYWLTEYLTISKIFREAPIRYSDAFAYTETDEGDTTYFILYHLEVITRAIDELHAYLRRKMAEVREVEQAIGRSQDFNYRQLALLRNALREPDTQYTFTSHARSHNVTHQTARTDLLGLHERGLLSMSKSGRRFVFRPSADLADRLR